MSTPKPYNERYSKTVTLQLGDFEKIYMALAVADDYLSWLRMRCTLPGSGQGICEQVHEMREVALKIHQSALPP